MGPALGLGAITMESPFYHCLLAADGDFSVLFGVPSLTVLPVYSPSCLHFVCLIDVLFKYMYCKS